ncbi:MAG: hypothetical protein R3E95_00245 [Thiolinea sp.]
MYELADIIVTLIKSLWLWGAWLGLVLAALITWILSTLLFETFHAGIFLGLAIPFLLGGAYLQHVMERKK